MALFHHLHFLLNDLTNGKLNPTVIECSPAIYSIGSGAT